MLHDLRDRRWSKLQLCILRIELHQRLFYRWCFTFLIVGVGVTDEWCIHDFDD